MKNKILKISKTSNYLGLALVAILFLSSCGSLAPFKERDLAMQSIEKAKTVEAAVYAPDPFSMAELNFDEGQLSIVEKKKSPKNKDAKKAFVKADTEAKKAYNSAVGLYIEAILRVTAEEIEVARVDKISNASPDLFSQAEVENKDAENLLADKNYDMAMANSYMSRETLLKARAAAAAMLLELERLLAEYSRLRGLAISQKAVNAVPDLFAETEAAKFEAEDVASEFRLQEAIAAYINLISDTEFMIERIEEKRLLAREELLTAEETIRELKRKNKDVSQQINELNKQYQSPLPNGGN